MTKFKNPLTLILLISFFLISTCTTNNSITGNPDQYIGKTSGVLDSNSPIHDDDDEPDDFENCLYLVLGVSPAILIFLNVSEPPNDLSVPYDFRDNFLDNSEKGTVYNSIYYKLSKYGIENNLVNKYYKEHYELLKNSTAIAYDLQYGSDHNSILINKKTSDALKDMLQVYRNSLNHKEIEPILNYLQADLEKYYNKPKYEIAADFESD